MFDFRIHTFLMLCQTRNYTKTARLLHITQPAVTGHIKYLENLYGMKLFIYTGKTLHLTRQGEMLHQLATTMQSDLEKKIQHIQHLDDYRPKINFGATLTIGEYTLPPLLCQYLECYPHTDIHMHVDNTHTLLNMLDEGDLDFAFIEGHFNKSDYIYKLFSKEAFIGVCSKQSSFAYQMVDLDEIIASPLIIREPGSGSRAIIEDALHYHHLSLKDFPQIIELGNLNAIKELVKNNYGITFIYEEAVKRELKSGSLAPIYIRNLSFDRAFHFICPKGSLFSNDYLAIFKFFKEQRKV